MNGAGGRRRIRATEVIVSGTSSTHSAQRRKTSCERCHGQMSQPACTCSTGYNANSIAVTPRGVDLDAAEAARADQDGGGKVAERGGAVACALRGDAEAVLGREPYGAGDVLRDLRLEDRDGLLVDGEVPRLPRLVPGCVA